MMLYYDQLSPEVKVYLLIIIHIKLLSDKSKVKNLKI